MLKIVSQNECRRKLTLAPANLGDGISNNMFCAKSNKKSSACHGDSGGPFVCRTRNDQWILRGVVSWGSTR